MTTSQLLSTGLLLGLSVVACRGDATKALRPIPHTTDADLAPTSGGSRGLHVRLIRLPVAQTASEKNLIDRIVGLHPGAASGQLRELLGDRFAQIQFPVGSAEQPLLNELAAAREAEETVAPEPVPATIALVDNLDASALVMIVRRKNALPHDVILLPRSGATSDALGAGLSTLFKMRRKSGDVPVGDTRIVLRGAPGPHNWKSSLQRDRALADLSDLAESAPRTVAGLGRVQAIDVPLRRVHAVRGHGSPATP